MVPSRCLFSSSHSSTFSKQPWKETRACEDTIKKCALSVWEENFDTRAGELSWSVQSPRKTRPSTSRFSWKYAFLTWDIPSDEWNTRWGVKRSELPMSDDFYMHTYWPYGQTCSLSLKCIPTLVHLEVSPWKGGGVRDLMVVSAAKLRPFLGVGAEAACKS